MGPNLYSAGAGICITLTSNPFASALQPVTRLNHIIEHAELSSHDETAILALENHCLNFAFDSEQRIYSTSVVHGGAGFLHEYGGASKQAGESELVCSQQPITRKSYCAEHIDNSTKRKIGSNLATIQILFAVKKKKCDELVVSVGHQNIDLNAKFPQVPAVIALATRPISNRFSLNGSLARYKEQQ